MDKQRVLPILQVDDVLLSSDILTEFFCCDLDSCHGACCVEGDAGAPVTLEEVDELEKALDEAWPHLAAEAQSVIDRQGVVYTDRDGDLVTSIVGNKDCVFTCHEEGCCLCALEKVFREGKTHWCKPISCSLYPIREKRFSNGMVGLNYHRWAICQDAVTLGRKKNIRIYQFLKEPLIRRFGEAWYKKLEELGILSVEC
ncbi:MAG: DUF3109 family protein [Prevotella sp.]|nr:DUF3109 family protein [Prevotella sp.]